MNGKIENSLEIGTVLNNKWVILEFIGKGGMGEVYRAHQLSLKRDVAIKVISREWLQCLTESGEEIETAIERFHHEMEAMAQLRHPNILQVFDNDSAMVKKGEESVLVEYVVMEYIAGGTLRSTMSEEGFHPEEDLTKSWLNDYFFPVLDGVEAIHELGMVHRDLKPGNILLDGNTPKITDFGLARSCRRRAVTQSVEIMGTAAYMPPEQFVDFKRTDQRGDIYSLGKILYEAIEGKITSDQIPFKRASLTNPKKPLFRELDRIIQLATAEDRKDRFQTIGEFRIALLEAIKASAQGLKGREPDSGRAKAPSSALTQHKRRNMGIALAAVLMVLIAAGLWRFSHENEKTAPYLGDHRTHFRESGRADRLINPGKQTSKTPSTLETADGVVIHRVPGGSVTLPASLGETGKPVKVDPFYMDETLVTNHQYVNFLNKVLSKIRVENGVVQSEGEVWFLLGEVIKGYEPIVFRDGKFHIDNSAHASCPVLRVTGYGASAYARFYGRRLPAEAEWFYAVKAGGESVGKPSADEGNGAADENPGDMMSRMMGADRSNGVQTPSRTSSGSSTIPSPVILSPQNALGIRGLNGSESEWGTRVPNASPEKPAETQYVILGHLENDHPKQGAAPSAVVRQAWEALERVGFRCVQSAQVVEDRLSALHPTSPSSREAGL